MTGAAPDHTPGLRDERRIDRALEEIAERDEAELHATCVAAPRANAPRDAAPRAVLLIGPPGAGKSSLALALIARGARLVADDRVALRRMKDQTLIAEPTAAHRRARLSSAIEARGLGLLRLPSISAARVDLVIRLRLTAATPSKDEERTPRQRGVNLCLCKLPLIETRMNSVLADGLYCLLHCGALLDPVAPIEPRIEDGRT